MEQENFPSGSASPRREWTPVFAQDGVTGTRFTLSPDTTKTWTKITEITIFKTLDSKQRGQVSLDI